MFCLHFFFFFSYYCLHFLFVCGLHTCLLAAEARGEYQIHGTAVVIHCVGARN